MRKIVKNPLIILAVGLIIVAASSVGATRAAITYSNEAQEMDFSTARLSVDIQEKQGDAYVSVSGKNGLTFPGIAEEMKTNDEDKSNDKPFTIGKKYPEEVQVVNNSTGDYQEYVRVMVRRSWTDASGTTKDTFLDPELISLGVVEGDWLEDTKEATAEGKAYYLKKPLGQGETAQFLKSITIDNEIVSYVKTVDGKEAGTVINEYKYDDKRFFVELRVDAVQQHNAKDAILGAWGVNVTLDGSGNITAIN